MSPARHSSPPGNDFSRQRRLSRLGHDKEKSHDPSFPALWASPALSFPQALEDAQSRPSQRVAGGAACCSAACRPWSRGCRRPPVGAATPSNQLPRSRNRSRSTAIRPSPARRASLLVQASGSNLVYIWSVTLSTGGTATFSANDTAAAYNATATFTKAGSYTISVKIMGAGTLSVTASQSVVVPPVLTSLVLKTAGGQVLSPTSRVAVSAASQTLSVQGLRPVRQLRWPCSRPSPGRRPRSPRRRPRPWPPPAPRRSPFTRRGRMASACRPVPPESLAPACR